jgi:hypothetical protein
VHVDQFDDLWTSTPDDARARTIDLLVEAATAPAESVSDVVTMRAGYYGGTAEHAALATLMAESQVLVPPMTTAEPPRRGLPEQERTPLCIRGST